MNTVYDFLLAYAFNIIMKPRPSEKIFHKEKSTLAQLELMKVEFITEPNKRYYQFNQFDLMSF